MDKLKICAFSKLTKQKFAEVRRLATRCKKIDCFEPFFYWESIKRRKNPGINEILCYSGDTLIGYLALYYFEAKEVEITVMTDPEHRSLAIYALLWESAKRVVFEFPVSIARTLFTCNQESIVLKEYLKRLGAISARATHKLTLTPKRYLSLPIKKTVPQSLRVATQDDIFSLQKLEADCFAVSLEFYHNYLLQALADPTQKIFVMTKNDKIIGKMHVQFDKKSAFLYGFCITPQEQKKGYGAVLLDGVITNLFNNDIAKILLDVVNVEDLQWYKRFNFKTVSTYEHWKLSLYVNPVKEREKQLETMLLNYQSLPVQEQWGQGYTKH